MAEKVSAEEQARIDKERRAAYAAAGTALREAHKEEFSSLYEAECVKRDVPFVKRLSARERAELEVKALLTQYPDLRASL